MGALKNLQDNVATLNTTVDLAIVALANKGVPESDVQVVADAVATVNTKLTTALNPPVV